MPVEKIPPASEKAVAVSNLREAFSNVYSSQDFASLESSMAKLDQKFFDPLSMIFDKHVGVYKKRRKELDKYALLVRVGLNRFWNTVQNIDRIAHIDFQPEEPDPRIEKERRELEHYILGYKLGLAYVWETLRCEAKEEIARLLGSKTWEELDIACNSMRGEVMKLMAEAGTTSPFKRCFIRQGKPDKQLLRKILESPQIVELTPDEKLDQMLLWYDDLEIIDSLARKYSVVGRHSVLSCMVKY